MGLLTEVGTLIKSWANGKFSVIGHNHDSAYEPKNVNIQNHISATNNPHNVTKSQVGLSNVTNDAQIKKNASSTDGAVPKWSGTTGDTLADGYQVETTLAGASDKLATSQAIKNYIDALPSGGGSLKTPVADLTTAKAIDTTNATNWEDKCLMLIETLGLYRLDRDSSATGDDNLVIQPTTGVGRWLKMTSTQNLHNNLSALQGGTTNEYYHNTLDTQNALAGTNGTPSAGNKFVTASDPKLTYLEADGEFPNSALTWTAGDLTAFENALNS